MATKLDKLIATVAISVATKDTFSTTADAAAVAAVVTPAEAAKLPQRWAAAVSSKAAGVPELRDGWQEYWYEALAEILCQMKGAGVPALLELWQQESPTKYVVLVRLLRLAQLSVERELILKSVEEHLPNARNGVIENAFRLIKQGRHFELVDLLRPMAHLRAGSLGDTVGTFIIAFDEQRANKSQPTHGQTTKSPLVTLITDVVAQANNPDNYSETACRAAAEIGTGSILKVVKYLRDTSQAEAARMLERAPADDLHALIAWQSAIMEILGFMGAEAASVAWDLLDDSKTPDRSHAIRLAVKLAARGTAEQREETIQVLASRLSKLRGVGMRYTIFNLMDEAKSVQGIADVLAKLGQVTVDDMDYEPQRVTIQSLMNDYRMAVEKQRVKVAPAKNQLVADEFAQAIFVRNFEAAFAMLLPAERAGKTLATITAEFDRACEHSGWPTKCLGAESSDLTAVDLRNAYTPRLPEYVADDQFLNWMEVEYLPDEEADTDADCAFYLCFAVVKFGGGLRIAAYQFLDD